MRNDQKYNNDITANAVNKNIGNSNVSLKGFGRPRIATLEFFSTLFNE